MTSMTLNQHKIENNVIIASLKSETMGKLINGIPGLRLLISNLPGSSLRTFVELLNLEPIFVNVPIHGFRVYKGVNNNIWFLV